MASINENVTNLRNENQTNKRLMYVQLAAKRTPELTCSKHTD